MFLSKPLFFHLLLWLNSMCCLFYIFLFYRKCFKVSEQCFKNSYSATISDNQNLQKQYINSLFSYEVKLKLGIKKIYIVIIFAQSTFSVALNAELFWCLSNLKCKQHLKYEGPSFAASVAWPRSGKFPSEGSRTVVNCLHNKSCWIKW